MPKPKQQEIKYQRVALGIKTLVILSIMTFGVVFLVQTLIILYLNHELSSVRSNITRLSSEVNEDENGKVKEQIKSINNVLHDYRSLAGASSRWSKMLRALVPLVPETVNLKSLTVDAAKKSVTITGFSPTREGVIELHDNIEADKNNFMNINYPLENVAKPKDVTFHFTFWVKEELLK